jgi:hypothetical protein
MFDFIFQFCFFLKSFRSFVLPPFTNTLRSGFGQSQTF